MNLRLVHDPKLALAPQEERIVMLLLSRLIGDMDGWRATTYNVCRVVAALEGLDVRRNAQGELEEIPFRSGKHEMLARDLAPRDLDQLWVAAKRQKRPLDRELLTAFIPEWLWPTFYRLCKAKPTDVVQEATGVFECWAIGSFSNGEPNRSNGPRSTNTLQVYITSLWSVFRRLAELHESLPESERVHVAHWARISIPKQPKAEEFDAEESSRDRSAPPLLSVRRALKAADTAVESKKRLARNRNHMFTVLRDRAVLGLLCIHGMRAEALWALDIEDFKLHHQFPDGSHGAALVVPRVKRETVEHTKFVPAVVAEWVQEYIDYIDGKSGEPMWRPERPLSRRHERFSQQTITDVLIRTLSPHCGGRLYSPHTLRHLASSLATLVGIEWIRERPAEFLIGTHGTPSSPQTFSDVLLGHALHHIADRYRDIDAKANRETWTKLTVEGIWEWLWGDRGARKAPDLLAIDAAEQKAKGTLVEVQGLEAQLAELEVRAKQPKGLSLDEGIGMLLRIAGLSRELAKAVAAHERALRELDDARTTLVPMDDAVQELPSIPETIELVSYADEEERPLVRTRLRPEEFRWAIGDDILPASTLRRWMSPTGKLPFPPGDRRNLFDPPTAPGELPEAVVQASAHRRYILVDKLDPTRFHADAWERILELCRQPEPRRPSRKRSPRVEIATEATA